MSGALGLADHRRRNEVEKTNKVEWDQFLVRILIVLLEAGNRAFDGFGQPRAGQEDEEVHAVREEVERINQKQGIGARNSLRLLAGLMGRMQQLTPSIPR